jgi:hypothetical protein
MLTRVDSNQSNMLYFNIKKKEVILKNFVNQTTFLRVVRLLSNPQSQRGHIESTSTRFKFCFY